MNDSTIRPGSTGNNDNGSTIRPGSTGNNDNGPTIRPGSTGGGDNSSTIRPGSTGGGNNSSTIRPSSTGGGGNSSTIRPGSTGGGNNSSTIRQDSTIRPGGNGASAGTANSTIRQGSGTLKGGASSGGQQKPQAARPVAGRSVAIDDKNRKGAIFAVKEFVLDGKKMKAVEYLPQISGEAQLVKVEAKGKKYMLKLYFGNIHPDHAILDKVQNIPQGLTGLMRLYQHGVWTNPDDTDDKRDYEVMELCEGGMLSEIDVKGNEEKWKKLAMQMACCIDLCHQRGFLHLDVKPENFLFVDKQRQNLVLGDFGLAVPHDANGKGMASQARTKKYASPEIYLCIDGQPVEVSIKTDFYSLGMSLIRMWMGKDEFEKVIGSLRELQLIKMKNTGKVPMPSGLSSHSLSLIKALLRHDDDERAGFAEIMRWKNGENLCPDTDTAVKTEMNIVFNGTKNQVAHSFEELAGFMMQDKELAKKYLYSGKLSKLLEPTNPEMAMSIDEITEEWYPNDKDAGLAAAIYTLNDELPFTDVNNKPCNTFAEIAHSLLYNFDKYKQELKDPHHQFYIYLKVNKEKDWANSIFRQMEKNSQDNLMRFIYEFNAKLPFRITTKDKKVYYPDTIDGILAYGNELSDDSKWEITSGGLIKWLYTRNAMIAGEVEAFIKKSDWKTECWPGVLYRLNKNCDYNFKIVSANSKDAQFTPKQLAERLNRLLHSYGKNSKNYIFFEDFALMKGRQLEYYLDARGLSKSKNYIQYCFNLNSSDNTKKPGPYNELIAAYKCIAGLGATPSYKTKDGKIVTTIADVEKLPTAVKQAELRDGTLKEFLTVLFQENPNLNLSTKYTYELETEKYLRCLAKIDSGNYYVKRFDDAVEKTENCVKRVKSLRNNVVFMRILVVVLALLPLAFFALYFIFAGLPFTESPLTPFNSTVFGIMVVVFTIAWFGISDGDGGCIGELIWGVITALAVYWGLHFILKWILPYSGYILGGLIGLYAWRIAKSTLFAVKLGDNTAVLGTDELVVAPLHFAYRSSQSIGNFTPTAALATQTEEAYLSANIKTARKKTAWAVVASVLLAVLLGLLNGGKLGEIAATSSADVEKRLVGSWNGEFQGRPATLFISSVTGNKVEGTMFVKFKRLAKENFSGVWSKDSELTLTLEDVNTNGILDGVYSISIAGESNEMTCRYSNKTSGKTVDFTLKKDENATPPANTTETSTSTSTPIQTGAKTKPSTSPSTASKASSQEPANNSGSQTSQTSQRHGSETTRQSTKTRTEEQTTPASNNRGGGFKFQEMTDAPAGSGNSKPQESATSSSSSGSGGFHFE